jgi:hypothetical protein
MEWRDQVAVVTGGARGLGRATARLLSLLSPASAHGPPRGLGGGSALLRRHD